MAISLVGLWSIPASAETLSLADSLVRATTNHPDIQSTQSDVVSAQARHRGVKAGYGPKLDAAANIQVWSDANEINIDAFGANLPAPQTPYEELISGLLSTGTISIRDQVTWDGSLTLTQPLTPLWDIHLASKISAISTQVARTNVSAAERRVRRDVASAFLRVNQARKAVANAKDEVTQLKAQSDRLQVLVEVGAAQAADKLRIDVALAAAQQREFRAEADLNLATSAFAVALGESDGADLDAAALEVGTLAEPSATLEELIQVAMSERDELQNLDGQYDQADLQVDLKKSAYKPDVVALAQYQHTEGQGLSNSDSFFVGASLRWNLFEWGKTQSSVDEASSSVVKVKLAKEQVRRQIGLQVRKSWFDYEASRKMHVVALSAVLQAEEAFRIENERFEAGQSTSTDLLAAQTALTEAKNNRDSAYYQGLVNRAEMTWAIGRPVTAENLIQGDI